MASGWVSEAQVIKLTERLVESEKSKPKQKSQQHEKWCYTVSLDHCNMFSLTSVLRQENICEINVSALEVYLNMEKRNCAFQMATHFGQFTEEASLNNWEITRPANCS